MITNMNDTDYKLVNLWNVHCDITNQGYLKIFENTQSALIDFGFTINGVLTNTANGLYREDDFWLTADDSGNPKSSNDPKSFIDQELLSVLDITKDKIVVHGGNGKIIYEYQLLNGIQNGYYRVFHQNGNLKFETEFINGTQKEGSILSYHENGKLAREVFLTRSGYLNGLFSEWFPNGNKKLDGLYYLENNVERFILINQWDEKGSVREYSNYSKDNLKKGTSLKIFNANDQLLRSYKVDYIGLHVDLKLEESRIYHPNGQLKEILKGPYKVSTDKWNEDGKRLIDIDYVLSTKHCVEAKAQDISSTPELQNLVFAESLEEIKEVILAKDLYELFVLQIVEHTNGCFFQYKADIVETDNVDFTDFDEYSLEDYDMNKEGGDFNPYKCVFESTSVEAWEFYKIREGIQSNELLDFLNQCAQNTIENLAIENEHIIDSLAFKIATVNKERVIDWFWTTRTNGVIDFKFCFKPKMDLL